MVQRPRFATWTRSCLAHRHTTTSPMFDTLLPQDLATRATSDLDSALCPRTFFWRSQVYLTPKVAFLDGDLHFYAGPGLPREIALKRLYLDINLGIKPDEAAHGHTPLALPSMFGPSCTLFVLACILKVPTRALTHTPFLTVCVP